ncbi:MAG: chlorite dismutase family protein [Chloroflexi bacterium]|nr:chlorite dismutase family protein [Chloroflexota bacterium]
MRTKPREQLQPATPIAPLFVQYLAFRLDPSWRRLPEEERRRGREEFALEVQREEAELHTYAYSGLGLKMGLDLLLWRNASSVDAFQASLSRLLTTGLGRYLEVSYSLLGLIRPSTYVRRPTAQEQAILGSERGRYLVVYPFSKTPEWYLLKPEERQALMNEHIRVGHRYPSVRQVLAYSFGLDDQEFIVAYEMEQLEEFEELVRALRETQVRRYTLRDTPILTCIHHRLGEALTLLG